MREAAGFQTFVDNGLQAHVQSTLTVDVPLVTGTVKQEVTVTAEHPCCRRKMPLSVRRSQVKP